MMITSPGNKRIKEIRKLARRKGERRGGHCLLEGPALIETALAGNIEPVVTVYDPEIVSDSLLDQLDDGGSDLISACRSVVESIADTKAPQGIVVLAKTNEPHNIDQWWQQVHDQGDKSPLLIMCDQVQDPGNAGTIIRTAMAVGAGGVLMVGNCADPYAPKSLRSAAGATFHIPVCKSDTEKAASTFVRYGYQLIATAPDGQHLPWELDLTVPSVIILGNEARGVNEDLMRCTHYQVSIPMVADSDSVNVAVAGAVVMYEALRQHSM